MQLDRDIVMWSESEGERSLREELYSLIIELPNYPHAVIYEEKVRVSNLNDFHETCADLSPSIYFSHP